MAAVVTGRVAESVGGRRTLDFLRALQQKKIDTERSRRTLRDSDDAARRQRRFATSMALRDGNDASRRRRRYATATTLRDGGLRVWRRKGGRAGGGQSKDGFWHGPLLSLAPERENSWTAVGTGGGWRDGRDGGGFRLRVQVQKGGRAGGWRPKQGRLAGGGGRGGQVVDRGLHRRRMAGRTGWRAWGTILTPF